MMRTHLYVPTVLHGRIVSETELEVEIDIRNNHAVGAVYVSADDGKQPIKIEGLRDDLSFSDAVWYAAVAAVEKMRPHEINAIIDDEIDADIAHRKAMASDLKRRLTHEG